MSANRTIADLENGATGASVKLLRRDGVHAMLGYGETVPTTDTDWGANALFIQTDGGAGARLYVNTAADGATCTFAAFGAETYLPLAGGELTGAITGGQNATLGAVSATSITGTGTVALTDNMTVTDAKNIILNTTTGTKIGTAVGQKLGLWNAAPVVQQAAAAQAALGGTLTGTTDDTLADVTGSWDATSIATINKNFKEVQELVNAIRTALVNIGAIKGAA